MTFLDRPLLVEWPSNLAQKTVHYRQDRLLSRDRPLSLLRTVQFWLDSMIWPDQITVPVRIGTAVQDFGPNFIWSDPWPGAKWSVILVEFIPRT